MVGVLVVLGGLLTAWLAADPVLGRLGLVRNGWTLYECHEVHGGSYPVDLPLMVGLPRGHRAEAWAWVQRGDTFFIAAGISDPAGVLLGTGVWTSVGEHGPTTPAHPANDLARSITTHVEDADELPPRSGPVRAAEACVTGR